MIIKIDMLDFKDTFFSLYEHEDFLEIEASDTNGFPSGCFVRKNGEIYGHYGYFDGGFPDPETEKFAQDFANKEIEEWVKQKECEK